MTLGEKIRKLRLSKDWTQKELGAKTGLGNNISSYEIGRLKPSAKTLRKIADAFEVPVEELLNLSPDSDSEGESSDDELYRLFREVGSLPEPEIQRAKWFLGVLVKQHRLQQMLAS